MLRFLKAFSYLFISSCCVWFSKEVGKWRKTRRKWRWNEKSKLDRGISCKWMSETLIYLPSRKCDSAETMFSHIKSKSSRNWTQLFTYSCLQLLDKDFLLVISKLISAFNAFSLQHSWWVLVGHTNWHFKLLSSSNLSSPKSTKFSLFHSSSPCIKIYLSIQPPSPSSFSSSSSSMKMVVLYIHGERVRNKLLYCCV